MSEIKETNVPNIYVSDLERLAKKVRDVVGTDDTEITFEFIIASLFPTSWNNIQKALSHQYTQGYIQGRIDKEEEIKRMRNIDLDCYNDD